MSIIIGIIGAFIGFLGGISRAFISRKNDREERKLTSSIHREERELTSSIHHDKMNKKRKENVLKAYKDIIKIETDKPLLEFYGSSLEHCGDGEDYTFDYLEYFISIEPILYEVTESLHPKIGENQQEIRDLLSEFTRSTDDPMMLDTLRSRDEITRKVVNSYEEMITIMKKEILKSQNDTWKK